MKRIWLVCLLLVSYVFLVAMGGVGGSASINVPEPAKDYAATIIDRSDISTRVEKFSFEGQTSISGKLGGGHVSINFVKIASISFALQDNDLKANVLLKDGKQVPVIVDKAIACYGTLPYGKFKIAMEDMKSITIHGLVSGQ